VDYDPTSKGGGLAIHAFQYVIKNGVFGFLPLQGSDGTCHASTTLRVQEVPRLNEFQILSAVIFGLVVVSITVGDGNKDFMDYEGGVYRGKCETKNDRELV
jgi:hypothetical protein